jgi:hypothetical protein
MFFDSTTAFGRRFFQRAWRVRRLSLYTYSKKDQTRPERFVVGPEVLGLWATTPGTLPRLQDLHIDEGYLMKSPTHETLLPDFLSHHTLHTLALSSSHVFVALFERSQAALISACAELHEVMLEMISCGDDEGFEDGVAVRNRWTAWTGSIVAHARNVRHLRIELPVDYADLRVLSTAPALETLNATHIVDVPLVPVPFPSDAFLSLLELTLEDDTKGARLSCNVLSFRASSKLERCTLTINTSLNKDRCALLTAVCKHERLAHLLIDSSDWWEVDSSYIFQDMWLLLGHLRPSLYMQTLQFTMDPGESFPVNDLHIARVLQLYPNLRSWQRPNHCDLWAAMSLEEFMTVIKDRPEVRILPIAIECSDLPSALARESFGTHNYNMSFRILLRAFTDELRGAIWDLFPEVSAAAVPRCLVSCLLSFGGATTTLRGSQWMNCTTRPVLNGCIQNTSSAPTGRV